MKKLLLSLFTLPLFASAQVNFKPYITEGYINDHPRITRDKQYPGFPDYIEVMQLFTIKGSGYFLGTGVKAGMKHCPIGIQIEVAYENQAITTTGKDSYKGRPENQWKYTDIYEKDNVRYYRFSPAVSYDAFNKKGLSIHAEAGVDYMQPPEESEIVQPYGALSAGVGLGYSGLMLKVNGHWGLQNMLSDSYGATSQRIVIALSVYPTVFF